MLESAYLKSRLLLKLLLSNPSEFSARVITAAEALLSPGHSPTSTTGLDGAAMLQQCSQNLKVDLERFVHEPEAIAIRQHIATSMASSNRPQLAVIHDAEDGLSNCCYALCRALRPKVVVETGVGSGVTTSFILQALAVNGEGRLWSIDLPPLGAEEFAGCFVPQHLRSRWTLLRGRSASVLPALLPDLPPLDVFLHDSLHTEKNMSFEYRTAWRKMPSGGVLLSDDISWSKAFERFVAANPVRFALAGNRFGIAVKP